MASPEKQISLAQLFSWLHLDQAKIFNFLKEVGVVKSSMTCPVCNNNMYYSVVKSNDKTLYLWKCDHMYRPGKKKRRRCQKQSSVLADTILYMTRIPVGKVMIITYMYINSYQRKNIFREVEVGNSFLRYWFIAIDKMLLEMKKRDSVPIGGEWETVEIIETGCKTVTNKSKTGVKPFQGIFWGFEVGSGAVFAEPVLARNAESLVAAIAHWVLPGTTIKSRVLANYMEGGDKHCQHLTVDLGLVLNPVVNDGLPPKKEERRLQEDLENLALQRASNQGYDQYVAYLMFAGRCRYQKKDLFRELWTELGKLDKEHWPKRKGLHHAYDPKKAKRAVKKEDEWYSDCSEGKDMDLTSESDSSECVFESDYECYS